MCVVLWTLTCKREDVSELEYVVFSAITCLNDCWILIVQGEPCSQGRWISFIQLDGKVRGHFSRKRPWSRDPKKTLRLLENGWEPV